MKLYAVLGVKRGSKIEILDASGNYHSSYVGDEYCIKDNRVDPFVTISLLLGLYRYRPDNGSKLDQETIDKLSALKLVFGNRGWIAKDEHSKAITWYGERPHLENGGLWWVSSGWSTDEINHTTINIPTDVCYDLSKPIQDQPIEGTWRRVTSSTWEVA